MYNDWSQLYCNCEVKWVENIPMIPHVRIPSVRDVVGDIKLKSLISMRVQKYTTYREKII